MTGAPMGVPPMKHIRYSAMTRPRMDGSTPSCTEAFAAVVRREMQEKRFVLAAAVVAAVIPFAVPIVRGLAGDTGELLAEAGCPPTVALHRRQGVRDVEVARASRAQSLRANPDV